MGSNKPCPGCGLVDTDRKSTEVCRACQLKLADYRTLKATVDRWQNGEDDMILARIGKYVDTNEYFHRDRQGQPVRNALFDLVRASSSVRWEGRSRRTEMPVLGTIEIAATEDTILINRNVASALVHLHTVIKNSLQAAYEAGKADGHNLLMRLANGDLAPNEHLDGYGSR